MKGTNMNMWKAIEQIGWKENGYDYDKCRKVLLFTFTTAEAVRIRNFVSKKVSRLYECIKKYEKTNPRLDIGSDDGMSDLVYHIVGLGETEFKRVLKDIRLLEQRYNAVYGSHEGYKESFSYVFTGIPSTPKKPEKPKIVMMCWKCANGLWSKNKGDDVVGARFNPEIFKGCKEDSRINDMNINELCPIKIEIEKKL